MQTSLPAPSDAALRHSAALVQLIRDELAASGGWMDFARYMHLALYAPGLGYYSGGAQKFGQAGDFVTAPLLSPLFARTLARQACQVLEHTAGDILELGAGTGQLAVDLLLALAQLGRLPQRYQILEVSAHLREVQQRNVAAALPPDLAARVQWLDALPSGFRGLILGNEVLDALPVHLLQSARGQLMELGVTVADDRFAWQTAPLEAEPLKRLAASLALPDDYQTEICPAAAGLVASLADSLQQGVILLLDYGFPRHEYYHPQRYQGTLMCHYRHYAHGDPFYHPGLQDITAHVDFSLVAQSARDAGLALRGYCGQAQFLINCGITTLLTDGAPHDVAAYAPLAAAAQKLLSPAEMGELFKVIALGRGDADPLLGFAQGDRTHAL